MRCSLAWSASSATTPVCSLFFLLRDLDVRMCRANACCLTTFPVPVFLNRLDAPLWVLSLGMKYSGNPNSTTMSQLRARTGVVPAELSTPCSAGYNEYRNAIVRGGKPVGWRRADRQPVCAGGVYTGSAGTFSRRPSLGIDTGLQAACSCHHPSAKAPPRRSDGNHPANRGRS